MPRLGHKKSRNGCRQCKARHVKCDESKPCSSCARHGVPCSLLTGMSSPDEQPGAPIPGGSVTSSLLAEQSTSRRGSGNSLKTIDEFQNPTPTSTNRGEESQSPASSTDTYPFLTKLVHGHDASEHEHWARDLELIHHWTTEACIPMCPRDDIKKMWTIDAPKEAIHYTYLMHQILTFSALHIAHYQPDKQAHYHALAIHHQDLAIKTMRPRLHNITPEDAPVLFATSTLVSICLFGERSLSASSSSGKDVFEDLLDAFALLQGMGGLFSQSYKLVRQSHFAPIMIPGTVVVPPQPVFALILEHVPDAVAFMGARNDVPEDIQRECLIQLLSFRDVIQHNSNPVQDSREMRSLFFWPLHVGTSFPQWVRERRQPVLVLLAYYAVALRAAESPKYWFFRGWSERLMRAVEDNIEPSWQVVVRWQSEFIMGHEAHQSDVHMEM